jgi:hypothetical protein
LTLFLGFVFRLRVVGVDRFVVLGVGVGVRDLVGSGVEFGDLGLNIFDLLSNLFGDFALTL